MYATPHVALIVRGPGLQENPETLTSSSMLGPVWGLGGDGTLKLGGHQKSTSLSKKGLRGKPHSSDQQAALPQCST